MPGGLVGCERRRRLDGATGVLQALRVLLERLVMGGANATALREAPVPLGRTEALPVWAGLLLTALVPHEGGFFPAMGARHDFLHSFTLPKIP
jgi:hypothetical protein